MNKEEIQKELADIVDEFGTYPYEFFTILTTSDNPNADLDSQNEAWNFIKKEEWHSLDLSNYILWSISDNGDLLWWNGEQTIAMNSRGSEFMSIPVRPRQFVRLIGMGKVVGIFHPSLWDKNA